MAKNFAGVMADTRTARFSAGALADMQEPRPYDVKLDILRKSLPDFDQWYQEIVNVPAAKWRAAIDEKINQLCDADQRTITHQ